MLILQASAPMKSFLKFLHSPIAVMWSGMGRVMQLHPHYIIVQVIVLVVEVYLMIAVAKNTVIGLVGLKMAEPLHVQQHGNLVSLVWAEILEKQSIKGRQQ